MTSCFVSDLLQLRKLNKYRAVRYCFEDILICVINKILKSGFLLKTFQNQKCTRTPSPLRGYCVTQPTLWSFLQRRLLRQKRSEILKKFDKQEYLVFSPKIMRYLMLCKIRPFTNPFSWHFRRGVQNISEVFNFLKNLHNLGCF